MGFQLAGLLIKNNSFFTHWMAGLFDTSWQYTTYFWSRFYTCQRFVRYKREILSWECWDFWGRHYHFRRFPKKSEVFRRSFKSSEDVRALDAYKHKLAFSAFHLKNLRPREGIVIYSFYTWFSFLTWVWVNIFLEIVSSKTATTHIFQSY